MDSVMDNLYEQGGSVDYDTCLSGESKAVVVVVVAVLNTEAHNYIGRRVVLLQTWRCTH